MGRITSLQNQIGQLQEKLKERREERGKLMTDIARLSLKVQLLEDENRELKDFEARIRDWVLNYYGRMPNI